MATGSVDLPTKSNDKEVKPREQMKGLAELKPGFIVYLSAAVSARLAWRQSAGNMERGRLSGNTALSWMLNKSKIMTEKFSSVATARG